MAVKALVVDDSQLMRRSLVIALQRLEGLVCREASDGAEGLKRLSDDRFDIVLTDINMPVMDGLKLIACVRRQGSAHATVPVVVISSEAAAEDRRRALALGANAYLVKPVQAPEVLDTVKSLLKIA